MTTTWSPNHTAMRGRSTKGKIKCAVIRGACKRRARRIGRRKTHHEVVGVLWEGSVALTGDIV